MFQHSGEFPWSGYKELDRGLSFDLSVSTQLCPFVMCYLCALGHVFYPRLNEIHEELILTL